MAVDRPTGADDGVRPQVRQGPVHQRLVHPGPWRGHHGFEVIEGRQQRLGDPNVPFLQDGDLPVGAGIDHHVRPGDAQELAQVQPGAHPRVVGLVDRTSEGGVGPDGDVDLRMLGQHPQPRETDGGEVHHDAVAPQVDDLARFVHHAIHLVGDVDAVDRLLAGLLVGATESRHDGLDPFHHRAVVRIGQQFVILDDVHPAHGHLVGQLADGFRRDADGGLGDGHEERSVRHSQELSDTGGPELGSLKVGQPRAREDDVQQLHLAAHGDVAQHRGDEFGQLHTDVQGREGHLNDELTLADSLRQGELVGRYLVHADDLGGVPRPDLGRLLGDVHPGACGLLQRQGFGTFQSIAHLSGHVVGRNDEILRLDALREHEDVGVIVQLHRNPLLEVCSRQPTPSHPTPADHLPPEGNPRNWVTR